MKQRLADYIADFLVEHDISDCFTVTGGGAMHLNDAFGHKEGLRCTYNHHEQACAIAAEAYARFNNRMALVCVTTGPGGINALNGVVGGWLDSIPMMIISGQVRYDTTARYNRQFTDGYPLRSVGDQEFDIVSAVECMCKYAVMVEDPTEIRYILERAIHLAKTGRPGPVWIDVPVNFQGATIETDELRGYDPAEDATKLPGPISMDTVQEVLKKIQSAKRPVLYAGNGIRLAGAYQEFQDVVEKLGIPVCTYWDSIDLIETEHPLYVGRAGNMGERAGNFAVQNADLILAIGNRLPIRVVGYRWETWAREAEVIMVDVDPAELRKPTIHVEYPIWGDAKDFLEKVNRALDGQTNPIFTNNEWIQTCQSWKKKYPAVLPHHWADSTANVYATFDYISRRLPEQTVTVTSNGSCCVVGHMTWYIKRGSRFYNQNAIASMGYGLPAAIGACRSIGDKQVICLEGDGSIMMNLQELQTVVTNQLPIKIILINNEGYHSIRQTQTNLFGERDLVGIGPDSKDLGFPDFKKVVEAFGLPYYEAHTNEEMKKSADAMLDVAGPAVCEVFVSKNQLFEPKNSARKREDGTIYSPPLEDLAPFLSRDEFMQNMFIDPLEE